MTSYVYFIRVGGFFKIGQSDNPTARFLKLHQSGTRYTFPPDVSLRVEDREMHKVIPGGLDCEGRIHLALDEFAVGLEWFLDEPLVREFIDALPSKGLGRRALKPVRREGGWCEGEYQRVQNGRAQREMARWSAKRAAS